MRALKNQLRQPHDQGKCADQIKSKADRAITAQVAFPFPGLTHAAVQDGLQGMVDPLAETNQNAGQREQLHAVDGRVGKSLKRDGKRKQKNNGAEREHGLVPLIDFELSKGVIHPSLPLRALLGNSKRNAKRVTCEVVSRRGCPAPDPIPAGDTAIPVATINRQGDAQVDRSTVVITPRGPVSLAYSTPTRAAAELAARNGWRLAGRDGRLAMVEA